MPFTERTPEGIARGGLADGLTEDIITRLAKLRVLFVIARGSVYALGERNIPPEEAGRLLNVDYVASGTVRRYADRVLVTAELSEARVARIVWVEEFTCKIDDALTTPDEASPTRVRPAWIVAAALAGALIAGVVLYASSPRERLKISKAARRQLPNRITTQ